MDSGDLFAIACSSLAVDDFSRQHLGCIFFFSKTPPERAEMNRDHEAQHMHQGTCAPRLQNHIHIISSHRTLFQSESSLCTSKSRNGEVIGIEKEYIRDRPRRHCNVQASNGLLSQQPLTFPAAQMQHSSFKQRITCLEGNACFFG